MTEQHQSERRTELSANEMAKENAQERADNKDRERESLGDSFEEISAEFDGENRNTMAQYGAVYSDDYGADEDVSLEEETASEVAPPIQRDHRKEERDVTGEEVGYREQMESIEERKEAEEGSLALGWTALVLSLVSLFFLPVLMATAGIVTGFFAYRGGNRTLGLWAIGVGLFSLIVAFFISPFLARF